ncbi:MAG: hypothetical protein IJ563_01780 [Selenomonadaceae bacterium]|nr:hypothetical protein [Selenomonadaceae bacterium]
MLKKFGIAAAAALIAIGTFAISEAAESNNSNDNYGCRDGYCYNRNYNQNSNSSDDYCGGYGCRGGRGCW